MACCNPQNVPFCANRNTMFASNITVRLKGKPFDFTNWTARMEVRASKGAPGAALISVGPTPNLYGSVITIMDNTIFVVIEQQDIFNLPTNPDASEDWNGVYDIVLHDADGRPNPFFGGPFTVNPGVTR